MKTIAVFGAGGALGGALVDEARTRFPNAQIYALSRSPKKRDTDDLSDISVDICSEDSVASAAAGISGPLDMVILATGMLHGGDIQPEKSLRDISAVKLDHLLKVNTIGPALVMKHFLPKLRRDGYAVFAALSARVGSISDNRLGGWYGYRASKAALNMLLKTASIEMTRRQKDSIIIGLHPGTVDSHLSKPFQRAVAADKLFSPAYSAQCLMDVLTGLSPADTGRTFDYTGVVVPF